jgi:hypothetical protein
MTEIVHVAVTEPTELERLVTAFNGPSYSDPNFLAAMSDELFDELLGGILRTKLVGQAVVEAEIERRRRLKEG